MAGHSKWANIKHRKGLQDQKRGKIFTKLIRELTISARLGGDDVGANPRLRAAIDKAYANNMSKDTVQRAIKRGVGGEEDTILDEVRYEGYGISGVAVIVDCMTDNRNRTVSEVRHAFTKNGGNLGTDGSVSYLFKKEGQIVFNATIDEEKLLEAALENGADDMIKDVEDGTFEVRTSPELLSSVKDALESAGFIAEQSGVSYIPATMVRVDDLETAEKLIRLIDMLEDLDDVQEVYTNADIPETLLEKMS